MQECVSYTLDPKLQRSLDSSYSLQVVLAVLVELGRSDVEGDRDLALVTGRFDSLHQELEGLLGSGNVGSETTLITDVGSCIWTT